MKKNNEKGANPQIAVKKGFQNTLQNGQEYPFLQTGYFAFYKKDKSMKFVDNYGKENELSRVVHILPRWNSLEGSKSFFKPFIYDGEKIIQKGDSILYGYVGSKNINIAVFGATGNYKFKHIERNLNFDFTNIDSLDEKYQVKNNESRYLQYGEDGKGNLIFFLEAKKEKAGNIVVKLKGKDTKGTVKLETNKQVIINQTDKDDKVIAQFFMDNTEGNERIKIIDKYKNKIELKKEGTIIETNDKIAVQQKGGDLSLKKILNDLIDCITEMTQPTPAGNTIAPPLNLAAFNKVKKEIKDLMEGI